MRIIKILALGLFLYISCHNETRGQTQLDSLRSILDLKKVPDSSYIKTSIELCKVVVHTEFEFLLPEYAIKGLRIDTLNHHIQLKFTLLNYLGNYYWEVGKLSAAADQFNQMRLLGEAVNDPNIASNSFIGLGIVHYIMGNHPQALVYFREGLALSGTDSLLKVRFYNNIANTFSEQGRMDSALFYYHHSIRYHESHQNWEYLSNGYANLALLYAKLRKAPEIRKNITLALESAYKSNDPVQIATVYQLMGDLAFIEHPDLAAKSFKMALDLAKKAKSYAQIRKSLENLSSLSNSTGKYKEAFDYLKEEKYLEDSLEQDQEKSRLKQIEFSHLAQVKIAEEFKKNQIRELAAVKDESRIRTLLIVVSVAFITLLILLLTGFQTYRMRMKISRTKERFFSMIAHDIRNPFSGILGLSGVLIEDAEIKGDPVQHRQMSALHQSLNRVYELIENLLQWSQAETGKIAFNPTIQSLYPFVQEAISLHLESGKQKSLTFENQIPQELEARFDSNMLQTIIRNLLSNAIKYSPGNSSIFISAEKQGKEVVIQVRDQGTGMSREKLIEIVKSTKGISTPGTRNEPGTGLGLILCKTFISRHGGRMWAESTPGQGTTIIFALPD
jgi:signal transduction histidine kinase